MLRSIEELHGNLPGEQQVKNPNQEHQILVIKRGKKSLKDDGREKQEPVSEFNGYQYKEEGKNGFERSHARLEGEGGGDLSSAVSP